MPINLSSREIRQFSQLELLAKQVVEGFITGLHKSPFHGFSVEFAEHRLYNSGESTRHIDWKLYGRTNKLFVKRYEEETNLRCQIVLDASSSMQFPEGAEINKLGFSIQATAALMGLLRKQRDAVGLSVFSEEVELHTPAKSNSAHQRYLIQNLEQLLSDKERLKKSFVVDALHEISEKINRRSLVMIFSDMFDSIDNQEELFSALQHLRHNKHEVVLFHVTDKNKELELDFENRPHTFVDLETGEEVKLNPVQVQEAYTEAAHSFANELKLKCGQYHIDFVQADINQGFNDILLKYLIKRQKML